MEYANYTDWSAMAQDIVNAMTEQGLNAALEYQYIAITLADGRYIAFGDCNDTWMGDICENEENFGNPSGYFDTGLSTDIIDPLTVAKAAKASIESLKA